MKYPEFRLKISTIIFPRNAKEKARMNKLSRKQLSLNNINLKNICSDKDVISVWIEYNRKQAEWEKYCRISKSIGRSFNFEDYFLF